MLPHEVRLYRALSKLNRFTPEHRAYHPVTSDEELGSSMAAAALSRRPTVQSDEQRLIANAQGPIQNYKPMTGDSNERQSVVAGLALPGPSIDTAQNPEINPQEAGKSAVDQIRTNELANQTRFNGTFTPNGLEQAGKEADANAADRLMMRQLVANSGMMPR
jgi:hypothetical protein